MEKKIAVIDKTGRGHSICDAIIRTSANVKVYYIPGTGGKFSDKIEIVSHLDIKDAEGITSFCSDNNIDLAVVSHIDALTSNVSDVLRANGIRVVGTNSSSTLLESSKWFCKELCKTQGVNIPDAFLINNRKDMENHLKQSVDSEFMIKADWLTKNGNGAILKKRRDNVAETLESLDLILEQNEGKEYKFVIEEFIHGYDYSAQFLIKEGQAIMLPSSQDFKKSHDGNYGINCDGMGSISPHPKCNMEIRESIQSLILKPLLKSLKENSIQYNGPLYLGIRITDNNVPVLLEINTRLGDSESEVIFPRLNGNLYDFFSAFVDESEAEQKLSWTNDHCLAISLVSGTQIDPSYLGIKGDWPYTETGGSYQIKYNPENLILSSKIYWANTKVETSGELHTGIGRVAHIAALGCDLIDARSKVYGSLDAISFPNMRWRKDIGLN